MGACTYRAEVCGGWSDQGGVLAVACLLLLFDNDLQYCGYKRYMVEMMSTVDI